MAKMNQNENLKLISYRNKDIRKKTLKENINRSGQMSENGREARKNIDEKN